MTRKITVWIFVFALGVELVAYSYEQAEQYRCLGGQFVRCEIREVNDFPGAPVNPYRPYGGQPMAMGTSTTTASTSGSTVFLR